MSTNWKDTLTVAQAMEIAAQFSGQPCKPQACGHPWPLNVPFEIRTATLFYAGQIIEVYDHEIVMIGASWVADEGRFTQAQATGVFDEVEMLPPGRRLIIGRGSIVSGNELPKTPNSQK